MKFLKRNNLQISLILVCGVTLTACGGGGGNTPDSQAASPAPSTPAAGTTPAPAPGNTPVAGTTPAPVAAPPAAGPAPATPNPAPSSPATSGPYIAGLPADFNVGSFLVNADGQSVKAFSGVGKIGTALASKPSDWSLDDAAVFETGAKAISRSRYLNGKYFVLGADSSSGDAVAVWYSTDAKIWKRATLPTTGQPTSLWDISYGNDRFVISGWDVFGNSSGMMQSIDGVTWNNVSGASLNGFLWKAVTYGQNKFVAVDNQTGKVATSVDGINWSVQQGSVNPNGSGIALQSINFIASRNLFIAGANARDNAVNATASIGNVFTSTDAVNWVAQDTGNGNNIARMTCDTTTCVAATSGSTPLILSSPVTNLQTWTAYDYGGSAGFFINDIVKTASGWLAGGTLQLQPPVTGIRIGVLLTSPNGTDWTKIAYRP